jgi:hypothetical protein
MSNLTDQELRATISAIKINPIRPRPGFQK